MTSVSNLFIPLIVFLVIIYAVIKKVNIYDVFIEGAKESFEMILNIFPPMLAMVLAVNILVNSEFINAFLGIFKSVITIPMEVVPMMLMRPISGSSSLAILTNIYQNFGPDSFIGLLGSVIQGSTDTTFYVLTLYFGSVGIKKIRYAAFAGIMADLIGIVASIIIVKMLF